MRIDEIAPLAAALLDNLRKVMIGAPQTLELVTAAALCRGHVLLEDMPGTGKTTLARSFAASVGGTFARIQFTPDLLPADITGMTVFRPQTGAFEFLKGPVFTDVLLADEINRATPRTQSALLECMEERQVTENGVTYPMSSTFLVIATQNPVETQGTFPLPEAQLDRFLMRLSLGLPSQEEAVALLRRFRQDRPLAALQPVVTRAQWEEAAALIPSCQVSEDLMRYLAAFCEAARDPKLVRLGPSPRAMLQWMRAGQALAVIRGRDYVIPDDLKELAVPVLAHRLILRGWDTGDTAAQFLTELKEWVPVPTEVRA